VELFELESFYPAGDEQTIVYEVTGRAVPPGGLPGEVGAVVDNVATVYAVYEAVQKNKPLISRVMTVTGKEVLYPGNYMVRFGTPIEEVIAMAGGIPATTGKIIAGGPMMGRAMDHVEGMPANKRISGLLFLPEAESIKPEAENCIRCGKCVDACPMGLEPYLLSRLTALEMWDEVEDHAIMDCIDCGCCVFSCPSHRRLLDDLRAGKAKVGGIIRARAAEKK
jgi:electron transport complex protein RnfC